MSPLRLSEQGTPATPGAGDHTLFFDSADKRYKIVDSNGLVTALDAVKLPRNGLINGGFNFAQRQVAGTLTTYSSTASRIYTADRWGVVNENASVQFQQIDAIAAAETGLLHRYYGRFKKITAAGKIMVVQVVSGEAMADYRGRRVRCHAWLRRTVAAGMTVRLGLAQHTVAGNSDALGVTFVSAFNGASADPTIGTNMSRLTPVAGSGDGGTIVGNGLNCVLTGAWVRYSACFDVPLDAKNLMFMVWSDAQLAAADELNITQCMLTDGPEICDWVPQPEEVELLRCLRYYCKSFPLATAPAQNTGLTGAIRGNAAQAGAVAFVHMGIRFPVPMRGAPTIVYFNPAAANAFLRYIITPSDATATSATQITESQAEVTATGLAAWVAGGGVAVHFTADAEI